MREFFYPDHVITVTAETQSEADKKLDEILNPPKPAKKNETAPQA
ncbi:MAG: hypothetical protein WA194_07215 [Patescibacteria group bacterium]